MPKVMFEICGKQGLFPFEGRIDQGIADSASGDTIKPILVF